MSWCVCACACACVCRCAVGVNNRSAIRIEEAARWMEIMGCVNSIEKSQTFSLTAESKNAVLQLNH